MSNTRCQETTQTDTGVIAYIDRYSLQATQEQNGKSVNVKSEAAMLKLLVGAFGCPKRLVAILNTTDEWGIAAYQQADFQVYPMNGDRPHTLPQFLLKEQTHLPTRQMIVVSADQAFLPLCHSAAQQNSRVVLWLPPGAAALATPLPIEQRPLHEVLPQTYIQPNNIFAWLDIENLLGAINRPNVHVDIAQLIVEIRTAARKLGDLKNIVAYGDFGLLAKIYGRDLQRELEQMQVHTRYVVNRYGKNSADMAIADDIHSELEHNTDFQTVLIGSGDRDFRPIVMRARKRNKKVVLLTFANSLSRELKGVADEVLYLDEYVDNPPPSTLFLSEPNAEQLTVVLYCLRMLKKNNWQWLLKQNLKGIASNQAIQQALADKILQRRDRISERRLILNPQHPLVKAADTFVPWFIRRVEWLAQQSGANLLDSEQFFCAIQAEPTLAALGIGHTSKNSQLWLTAATAARLGQ